MKSDLLQTLKSRGFINSATSLDGLDHRLTQGPITAYVGFDLTAPTLHVGSLIQIMLAKWLITHGHNVIVLLGTSTTKIGDPSGKTESRPLLDDETIQRNQDGITSVLRRILGDSVTFVVNDWFGSSYIDFIRQYGPLFTVNRMLSLESVKSRLDRQDPMTFLEFNYVILQSVDFLELNSRHHCDLQVGGSDQWGNIVAGVDLIRRVMEKPVFGLTTPLMTNSAGEKMGKTAKGAVWLSQWEDEDHEIHGTSPYEFWQFWRNIDDAEVSLFWRLFTETTEDLIYAWCDGPNAMPINDQKVMLANAVTTIVWGAHASEVAHRTAITEYMGGIGPDTPNFDFIDGEIIVDALVRIGVVKSKGEGDRLAANGGVKINNVVVKDVRRQFTRADFIDTPLGGYNIRIAIGKKKVVALVTHG